MKTKVFGQKIKNTYSLKDNKTEIKNSNGESKMVYVASPKMEKEKNVKWVEICEFEGEPKYNYKYNHYDFATYSKFNISENEEVSIIENIFRADLNELHLHTNKILEITDLGKENAETLLENELKSSNKEMIEADEKMKSYCLLHKLNLEETDCIELFKLLYDTNGYMFKDNRICPINLCQTLQHYM